MLRLHLLFAAFHAIFEPSGGGRLEWYKASSSAPVHLRVNAVPACGVSLSSLEALDVADVIQGIVASGASDKTLPLGAGGTISIANDEFGNVRVWTQGNPLVCGLLLAGPDEPIKAEDAFRQAGLF